MKFNFVKRMYYTGLIAFVSLMCFCTNQPLSTEGGGSREGNPVVMGTIANPDGTMARNAQVSLIVENFNPSFDTMEQSITNAKTDSLGAFSIVVKDTGSYNIEVFSNSNSTRLIRFNVKMIRDSTTVLPIDTLHKPGAIKVALPKNNNLTGAYVFVPGTTIMNRIEGTTDTITLDSVPVGVLPVLCMSTKNSAEKIVISNDVAVVADNTTLIQNWEWSYKSQIILNTSISGAGTTNDLYNFPVLIRLTSGNFDFSQAQGLGFDIRFSTSGAVPLYHEIELWDSVNHSAAIWVKVDTIHGNNALQSITMYWGNPDAKNSSNSVMVFDTSAGYQGVWHCGDITSGSMRDATVNGFTGNAPDSSRPLIASGVAGKGYVFDGKDVITLSNTSASKLNFAENGNFTISAWANVDTFDAVPHVVVAKGYDQYFLRSSGALSAPLWNFAQLGADNNWMACTTSAVSKKWTFITSVRQGNSQSLYYNGVLVNNTPTMITSASFSRNTSSDVSIGAFLKVPTATDGYCFFKGTLDEIRMINTSKSPDWILLCYMNQRSDDRLVSFGKVEGGSQ